MGRQGQLLPLRIVSAQHVDLFEPHLDPAIAQTRHGRDPDVLEAAFLTREMLGRSVHRVDIIVAIVKEVTHFLPGAWARTRAFVAERLVERGQPFMGLAVGAVKLDEGPGQRRRVGGRQPQVGHRGRVAAEDRIGQRLAHVADEALAVAARKLRDIEAEFAGQRQDHRRGDRPVVVLHLVEVGQRHLELGGEILLCQPDACPDFAQFGTGIKLLNRHATSDICKSAELQMYLCKTTAASCGNAG